MRRTWTIIGVGDVPGSFKWYQSLLGLPETAPAHDDFGQIVDAEKQEEAVARLPVVGAHQGGMLMRTPFVKAEQDRSIRVEDLTKVVMGGSRLRQAK